MNKFFTMLTGMGIGAGLMYFNDPSRGRRRRALVRDQINSKIDQVNDAVNVTINDMRNRGQGLMYQARSMMQQQNDGDNSQGALSPTGRVLMASGGGLLALYGKGRGGLVGPILSLAGMGLLARGVTNMNLRRFFGLSRDRDVITVQKAININASPDDLYTFWSNYENFPRFMEHVKEVRDLGNGRSHWVVDGPAGTKVEWDAVITMEQENHLISWKSVDDSPVKNEGFVRFDPNYQGGTRVTVQLKYTPPAGVVGHAVATMFGSNPKQEMDDDLGRLKTLFETGKTKVKGERRTGSDLAQATS